MTRWPHEMGAGVSQGGRNRHVAGWGLPASTQGEFRFVEADGGVAFEVAAAVAERVPAVAGLKAQPSGWDRIGVVGQPNPDERVA